ncbi:MAG: 30S ribosomal protein S16 [Prochlorococcaceae cyanobacterium]
MIKLRLKRFGKKREASFRIVVTNSTSRRDGRPLEQLGFYNPRTKETRLDTDAIRARLSQGAQPTDSVRSLLEKGGLITKTVRPAEILGKQKQALAREAAEKEARAKAAEEAAAAKAASEEAAAKAAAEAAAAAAEPAVAEASADA